MIPTRRCTIRDDDAAYIGGILDDEQVRMDDQQAATHDYTLADLRRARLRRKRIRKALHLEDNE